MLQTPIPWCWDMDEWPFGIDREVAVHDIMRQEGDTASSRPTRMPAV